MIKLKNHIFIITIAITENIDCVVQVDGKTPPNPNDGKIYDFLIEQLKNFNPRLNYKIWSNFSNTWEHVSDTEVK